jgi:deoxycytidine triphosphate deaminase
MDVERKKKELERLSQYSCPAVDTRARPPVGVLLSDEIEHYVGSFKMIDPFTRVNLKSAGYELTVGDEFVLGGKKEELKKDGEIRIPPFNVVVIKTGETINLPRFLIARWNVRVRWAYEGLVWVGGPQVDPGWIGHLFCPLYNLSDKDVVLRYGDPIALMDFVTTTPFNPGKSIEYLRPPKRVLLEEYRAAELRSALYSTLYIEAKRHIKEIERETGNKIDRLEKRMEFFVGTALVIITVLFAVLGVFTTYGKDVLLPVWPNIGVVFSIVALALAFIAFRRSKPRR